MRHFLNFSAALLLLVAIATAVAGIIEFRVIFIFMALVEATIANSIYTTAKRYGRRNPKRD